MIHSPSHPSWMPRISQAPSLSEHQRKLAVSTLAIALLLVTAVVWLIVAYL